MLVPLVENKEKTVMNDESTMNHALCLCRI